MRGHLGEPGQAVPEHHIETNKSEPVPFTRVRSLMACRARTYLTVSHGEGNTIEAKDFIIVVIDIAGSAASP